MTPEATTFPEETNNELRLALAIKVLANELKTNEKYRRDWEAGITTSMLNQLQANGRPMALD